ncbi:MAG: hypothetical protein D6722_28420 [Bacteroidetes bacterium]|nr:MAG: hypothetical protein D6722_28420 [Bacteroidota bacterium]
MYSRGSVFALQVYSLTSYYHPFAMRKAWLIALMCLSFQPLTLSAEHVLGGLNFHTGNWTMVGVPVHNYRMLPVQQDLGTFISQDRQLMTQLQQSWDLEPTYEDNCDYHYTLKFYQDGILRQTMSLNLYCGYITHEGLSYRFSSDEFERLRISAQPAKWSRITFGDMGVLKRAIEVLEDAPGVYWYDDVQQYRFSGYCMLNVTGLPWNTDVDSLRHVVANRVRMFTGRDDFYLQEYFRIIRGDELQVRYTLNCEQDLAHLLTGRTYMNWRSHLANQDSVRIVAIGIDEQAYRRLMNR